MAKDKRKKAKTEFSKVLLIQESILIWILTFSFLALAVYYIKNQYYADLPWLTAMYAFPWTAYGVSQACYYKKSEKENTKGGIKYQTAVQQLQQNIDEYEDAEDYEDVEISG